MGSGRRHPRGRRRPHQRRAAHAGISRVCPRPRPSTSCCGAPPATWLRPGRCPAPADRSTTVFWCWLRAPLRLGEPPRAAAGGRPAANRFGVPPAVEPPDQTDLGSDPPEVTDQSQGQVNPFANAFGQAAAGASPFGQPGAANPFGQVVPQQPQAFPQGGSFFQPLQPAQAAPGGFFSSPGSSTPGMVLQPAQPVQPGVRPRPQG